MPITITDEWNQPIAATDEPEVIAVTTPTPVDLLLGAAKAFRKAEKRFAEAKIELEAAREAMRLAAERAAE
jgi:hypothetical protein